MTDIKVQLQQAHTLIKEKQFQQARRLLIGIDHPLAEEWLARIDTLVAQEADKARVKKMQAASSSPAVEADRAPRRAQKQVVSPARPAKPKAREAPLTPEQTKERLVKAGELMKRQQYDEARTILEKLDHPKAAEWLARLDNIAPTDAPATSLPTAMAGSSPVKLKQKPLDVPLPDTPPEDPFSLMPRRIGSAPFALFNLASNWNRLGKPVWGTITTIVAGVIFLALLGSGAFWLLTFKEPVIPMQTMYGLLLGLAIANLSFPYMIAILQSGAYRCWQQGDVRGMLEYRYPVALPGGWVGLMVVAFIVTNIVGQAQFAPQVFSNNEITFSYPAAWKNRAIAQSSFCQELYEGQTCLQSITRGAFVSFLMVDELSGPFHLETADRLIWEDLAAASYKMDGTATTMTIDNHPAILRRYFLEDGQRYEMQLLVVHSNNQRLFFIIGTAKTKGIMDEYWHEVEQIMENLDFHDNNQAE
jgi:hypothetical protein